MKRKQIYLPASQERELQRLAEERGDSEALVIREAMSQYFAKGTTTEREPYDAGHSDAADAVRRKQIYIEEEQDEAVKELAIERGVSQSLVFREAVAQYISGGPLPKRMHVRHKPALAAVGLAPDSEAPMSEPIAHDGALYGTAKAKHIRMEDTPLWAIVGIGPADVHDNAEDHDEVIYGVAKPRR